MDTFSWILRCPLEAGSTVSIEYHFQVFQNRYLIFPICQYVIVDYFFSGFESKSDFISPIIRNSMHNPSAVYVSRLARYCLFSLGPHIAEHWCNQVRCVNTTSLSLARRLYSCQTSLGVVCLSRLFEICTCVFISTLGQTYSTFAWNQSGPSIAQRLVTVIPRDWTMQVFLIR